MKKLVILGGGESGVGAAILAKQKGWEVFLSDKGTLKENYKQILDNEQVSWEEGFHTETKILQADCIVKSPGIADKAEIIQKAKAQQIPIISEIEFASQYTDNQIVAITGSNGKTTTTMLTHYLLTQGGINAEIGGNIGLSFAGLVAKKNTAMFVLEISSFQLDGIEKFAPHIAIITNITPDHLDRYDYKFENYIASKFRITKNQTENDFLIYDADDPVITDWLEKNQVKAKLLPFSLEKKLSEGAFIINDKIKIMITTKELEIQLDSVAIKGKHNLKNAMASSLAAQLLNVRKESIRESLKTFKGAAHRLEEVKTIDGVTYINDSKATNVNSVYFALDSIKTPIVLILGGVDKGNDYSILKPFITEKVKAIVCLGKNNQPIINSLQSSIFEIFETQSMQEAVQLSKSLATEGDTVLLSPACASFDLFENYEDRGNQFKAEVEKL